ncbi:hypothetical protein [Paenibacillus apiarius]|uniref:Uncharacterized protein n=1 Tax=Paenibacillus apiarius TaxID=46240 RepID=A0ABT4DUN9_9BACL|nr:hypothetical protein [Paenibacillus apiarius]MCY9513307.1 hypothetical protein [Paenibacillus apiarius]MCY9519721.1 hypothetical protein [Paenibacillus apiarius]MCY9553223.1 hypothetical protein [Paenibacillus apiarius]MCY9557073.1 hypothetical protein [Paenibacillus apiarius]MCY9682186.1 hypothetical protein [Paenibacillus apiarius]
MNLNPRVKEYGSQVEILYTVKGSIEKVGGITLDGTKFPVNTLLKAGTAVSIQENGLAKPWADEDKGKPYLTNHNVSTGDTTTQNVIVGAWEEALVVQGKLTGITDEFKTAAGNRYRYY